MVAPRRRVAAQSRSRRCPAPRPPSPSPGRPWSCPDTLSPAPPGRSPRPSPRPAPIIDPGPTWLRAPILAPGPLPLTRPRTRSHAPRPKGPQWPMRPLRPRRPRIAATLRQPGQRPDADARARSTALPRRSAISTSAGTITAPACDSRAAASNPACLHKDHALLACAGKARRPSSPRPRRPRRLRQSVPPAQSMSCVRCTTPATLFRVLTCHALPASTVLELSFFALPPVELQCSTMRESRSAGRVGVRRLPSRSSAHREIESIAGRTLPAEGIMQKWKKALVCGAVGAGTMLALSGRRNLGLASGEPATSPSSPANIPSVLKPPGRVRPTTSIAPPGFSPRSAA